MAVDLFTVKVLSFDTVKIYSPFSGDEISEQILEGKKLLLALPWALMETHFSSIGRDYEIVDYPLVAAKAINAIAFRIPYDLDSLPEAKLEPKYLRKSTPEEKIEKKVKE